MTMVLSEEARRPQLTKVRSQMLPPGPPSPDSTPPRMGREPSNHHSHNDSSSRTEYKMRPPPAPKGTLHKPTKGEASDVRGRMVLRSPCEKQDGCCLHFVPFHAYRIHPVSMQRLAGMRVAREAWSVAAVGAISQFPFCSEA